MDSGSHKRQREDNDIPVEAKKPRLEDPLPSAMLEEALSDISDDPDEILNREDIVSDFCVYNIVYYFKLKLINLLVI